MTSTSEPSYETPQPEVSFSIKLAIPAGTVTRPTIFEILNPDPSRSAAKIPLSFQRETSKQNPPHNHFALNYFANNVM